MKRLPIAAIGLAAALAVAAVATAGPAHTSATTTVIKTRNTKYGPILVNASNRTIYLDRADKPGKLACTGGCLSAWPPVKALGTLKAQGGVKASLLGSVKDGAFRIVTYKGHPLYLFASDSGTAVSGEGVGGFDVVSPAGNAVTSSKTTTKTTTSSSSTNYGY